jgi:hypothetical protein
VLRNQNATRAKEMRIGTSTSGPMTVAKDAPSWLRKVAMATAIANWKLLEAAVKGKDSSVENKRA